MGEGGGVLVNIFFYVDFVISGKGRVTPFLPYSAFFPTLSVRKTKGYKIDQKCFS
jgi:hypothetical protein